MSEVSKLDARSRASAAEEHRKRLLAGLPVTTRQMPLAGIRTTLLEAGDGAPLILLHGPGESAVNWRWVIPDLAETYHLVTPDLPAHGDTGGDEGQLDEPRVIDWLDALIERTCARPPVLVGHVLGGAIAARYAVRRAGRLRGLVLVDSLGLARFRPSLRFLLAMIGFQIRPTEGTYERFMRQCAYDLDALRDRMGAQWDVFVAYNLALARTSKTRAAGRLFRELGLPRIPPDELEQIAVPVSLIWGRDDRALRLSIAESASRRYGWPLHVIEDSADDPARDRPAAFVEALRRATARLDGQVRQMA